MADIQKILVKGLIVLAIIVVVAVFLSVILVATAEIAGAIVDTQTNRIIDELRDGCSTAKDDGGLGLTGSELAICLERVEKSRDIRGFNAESCSTELQLTGEDLTFCEQNLNENEFLINLAKRIEPFTTAFSIEGITNTLSNPVISEE